MDCVDELFGFDCVLCGDCCCLCIEIDCCIDDVWYGGQCVLYVVCVVVVMYVVDVQCDCLLCCGGKWFSYVGFFKSVVCVVNGFSINIFMMVRLSVGDDVMQVDVYRLL